MSTTLSTLKLVKPYSLVLPATRSVACAATARLAVENGVGPNPSLPLTTRIGSFSELAALAKAARAGYRTLRPSMRVAVVGSFRSRRHVGWLK